MIHVIFKKAQSGSVERGLCLLFMVAAMEPYRYACPLPYNKVLHAQYCCCMKRWIFMEEVSLVLEAYFRR